MHAFAAAFRAQSEGARLILKEVSDPQRFGVAVLDGEKVIAIEEKPATPKSNYAVTGIYMYDSQVFDFIEQCTPSRRGELEITDVNNFYIQKGCCYFDSFEGLWTDAGTFESLKRANEYLLLK